MRISKCEYINNIKMCIQKLIQIAEDLNLHDKVKELKFYVERLVLQRSLIYKGINLFKCTQYGEKS